MLQQGADEFGVHLNSVESGWQRWRRDGLAGLYEGWHSGRPLTLSRRWREQQDRPQSSGNSLKCYFKRMGWRYKRYRFSLKDKHDDDAFEHARGGHRVTAS